MAQSPIDIISDDLSWREAELGSLKMLMARNDVSDHQKLVLLRASWALLYAHFEGFVKTSLSVFFDEAKSRSQNCLSLPAATMLYALERKIKQTRKLPSGDFIAALQDFHSLHLSTPPEFPDVDTKSNLWADTLEEILGYADISVRSLSSHRIEINTLVNRRNKIAHGQREMIVEVDYYRRFESATYELMYDIAYAIDERLKQPPYG